MRAVGFRFGSAIARTITWSGKAFRSSEARPLRPPPPAGADNGSRASDEKSVRRIPGFSCVRTRRFHGLSGQWRNKAVVRAPGFEVELGPPRRQPLLPVADHRADLVAEFLAEVLRAGPQDVAVLPSVEMHPVHLVFAARPDYGDVQALRETGFVMDAARGTATSLPS